MHSNFEIESPYFTFWNETTLILDGGDRAGAGGRPELRVVVVAVVVGVVAAGGGGDGGVVVAAAVVVAAVVCYGN
jgi:hypothetical protein